MSSFELVLLFDECNDKYGSGDVPRIQGEMSQDFVQSIFNKKCFSSCLRVTERPAPPRKDNIKADCDGCNNALVCRCHGLKTL